MIDCARSTLLVTVNTICACVYFVANVGKVLSFLFVVLIVENIQYISSTSYNG